jgi:molecular chaperone GrpE
MAVTPSDSPAPIEPEGSEAEATFIPPESGPAPDPLAVLQAERDELRDLLLRTRAEMDNMRKRMNRERDEERRYAALPVVQELLPALDNLQRAVAAGQKDRQDDPLVQGVEMVVKQIEEALSRQGVKPIPALGLPFDPNFHEALQQVATADHPPLTVLQELERGVQIHDRVVRPSKVIVAAAPAKPEA